MSPAVPPSPGCVLPPLQPDAWQQWSRAAQERALQLTEQLVPRWSPAARAEVLAELYAPVAAWWQECLLSREGLARGGPLVVSVGGLPGTGKTSLVAVVAELLSVLFGRRVVTVSLDDLYHPRGERERLALSVHPLLLVRGVPGTHDVRLGLRLVDQLVGQRAGEGVALPRFDKIADDRTAPSTWPRFEGRPELVVCEGWFWGACPVDRRLDVPENAREAAEDADGVWRAYVLDQLSQGYPELFRRSLAHVQLASPHFEASLRWRIDQEEQALLDRGRDPGQADRAGLQAFLQLFQRVGRYPRESRCSVTAELNDAHRIASWRSG